MTMEAKHWSEQKKFHVVYDDYVHAATAKQALAIALAAITEDETVWDTFAKATPAEPSSPDPSYEATQEEIETTAMFFRSDKIAEKVEARRRLMELLRIEAAYKRGGGK